MEVSWGGSVLRGKVVLRLLLNFPPRLKRVSFCERRLPWVSVPPYYLCMLDGRGHSWRLSSDIPCEEDACCGPQLAALMNSFTCYSLRSTVRSWGPNYTRTACMKLHWVSNQPQRRRQQHRFSVMYFCRRLWPAQQRYAMFSFTVTVLTGKTTELLVQTSEMTYVYVFLTRGLLRFCE